MLTKSGNVTAPVNNCAVQGGSNVFSLGMKSSGIPIQSTKVL